MICLKTSEFILRREVEGLSSLEFLTQHHPELHPKFRQFQKDVIRELLDIWLPIHKAEIHNLEAGFCYSSNGYGDFMAMLLIFDRTLDVEIGPLLLNTSPSSLEPLDLKKNVKPNQFRTSLKEQECLARLQNPEKFFNELILDPLSLLKSQDERFT